MKLKEGFRALIGPNDQALAILGKSGSHMTCVVERYAMMLARQLTALSDVFKPNEWCAIVDACQNTSFDAAIERPADVIVHAIMNAVKLRQLETQWDIDTEQLVKKLFPLPVLQGWAIVHVVYFFWRHKKRININSDAFWTIEFMTRINAEEVSEVGKGKNSGKACKIPQREKRAR